MNVAVRYHDDVNVMRVCSLNVYFGCAAMLCVCVCVHVMGMSVCVCVCVCVCV